MPEKVLAATLVEPMRFELREYDMPEIGPDDGLLRIERCGICGSDVHGWQSMYRGVRILGHENIGHIAKIGSRAAERWGVKEGDRVALEEYVPCGECEACRSGNYRFCWQTDIGRDEEVLWYGSTPASRAPALWGGYAQYMYMHPGAVVHKLPTHVPPSEAAFFLPLANGFEWAINYGGVDAGKVVVVQGPGQQGLACALAAKQAGAAMVIVSGIGRDEMRLSVASQLGADITVNVDTEDLVERVKEATGGHGADVVINVTGAAGTVAEGVAMAALNGIVVLGAPGSEQLDTSGTGRKNLTMKWAHGHSYESVERAIQTIASGSEPISLVTTHHFGLADAAMAVRSVAGEGEPGAIHVSIDPWLTT
jgi:threonine dehydrogenase-like Zn-dependent dehydrogenase